MFQDEEKVPTPLSMERYDHRILMWANTFGLIFEDIFRALLGFVGNGLDIAYNSILKNLPIIKTFFAREWVERFIKLMTGITLVRELSSDIAYLIFRPMGYFVGLLVGLVAGMAKAEPTYQQQFGRLITLLSGQTVIGAVTALIFFAIGCYMEPGLSLLGITWQELGIVSLIGGGIGLMAKAMMLTAIELVQRANAATSAMNANRADKVAQALKMACRQKTEKRIKESATDVIEQINGPQEASTLETFFEAHLKDILESPIHKVERHFNYLKDRAIHGDLNALKKLMNLTKDKRLHHEEIESVMQKIINDDEIRQVKNKTDSLFDNWRYQHLRSTA